MKKKQGVFCSLNTAKLQSKGLNLGTVNSDRVLCCLIFIKRSENLSCHVSLLYPKLTASFSYVLLLYSASWVFKLCWCWPSFGSVLIYVSKLFWLLQLLSYFLLFQQIINTPPMQGIFPPSPPPTENSNRFLISFEMLVNIRSHWPQLLGTLSGIYMIQCSPPLWD